MRRRSSPSRACSSGLRVERLEFARRSARAGRAGRRDRCRVARRPAARRRGRASSRIGGAHRPRPRPRRPPQSSSRSRWWLRRRERLELVLAVHVDQQFAERAQRLHRHRLAVDVGAAAPVGADAAAQHAASPSCVDLLFVEPGAAQPAFAPTSKVAVTSARSAPWRTAPLSARPPTASSSASTRIDLPAPVSPVSTVKPRRELELDRVDDREIADLQVGEHRRAISASGGSAGADRRGPSAASSAGCGSSRGRAGAAAWPRSRPRQTRSRSPGSSSLSDACRRR